MNLLGTFAPYMTVHKDCVVKIDPDIPFESAAIMGCAVPTGFGSATNVAAGATRRDGRHRRRRRHRHERAAGRGDLRCPQRRRDRPGRVQAGSGDQVRRHPRVSVDGRGDRAVDRRHARPDGGEDDHRRRRDARRVHRGGVDPDRQDRHVRGDGHGRDDRRRRQAQPVPVHDVAEDVEGQHLRRRQLATSRRRS